MSLATVTLSGTIKDNAQQRTTPNGNPVTNFMMNITRYDGRAKEEKQYPVKITLWGDSFAQMSDKLTAGTRVIVAGRLQIEQFTDKNGKNVKLLAVEANKLNFISDMMSGSNASNDTSMYDEAMTSSGSETDSFSNEEIPF